MRHTREILEILQQIELINIDLDWVEGYIDNIIMQKECAKDGGKQDKEL